MSIDVAPEAGLELVARAGRHELAVVDDRDRAGEAVGFVEVLGGEDDVGAPGGEALDGLPELVAAAGVEAGGGLVEQQQLGRAHQAGAEVEPALHAARVGAHEAVAGVGEPELLEHDVRRAVGGLGVVAEEAGDHPQVLAAGHRRLHRRVLAGEADGPPHLLRVLGDVDAGDGQGAGVELGERGDRADERGLARAVRSEDGEDLAGLGGEVEAVERVHVTEVLVEAAGLDHVVHGGAPGVGKRSFWQGCTCVPAAVLPARRPQRRSRDSSRRISRYSHTRVTMIPKAPYHSMYFGAPASDAWRMNS